MYLLDTNVCIDFALVRDETLSANFRRYYRSGLAISAVTLAELRVGARLAQADREDDRRLDRLVSTIAVHPFDEAAAGEYGRLIRQAGVKRKSFDRLIAAHALALGLTLVTRNEADFRDVPGLRVENWSRPADQP